MAFARENDFNDIIRLEAARQGVPYALIKAVIATESGFVPTAYRGEPKINDASRGLTQMLGQTARGMGYTGPIGNDSTRTGGLYDPAISIRLGTQFLKGLLARTGGKIEEAISGYNGGFRPSLGFGSRATKPVRVCLARDQKTGDCIQWRDVKVGEFGNQPHVDRVMRYYRLYLPEQGTTTAPSGTPPPVSPNWPIGPATGGLYFGATADSGFRVGGLPVAPVAVVAVAVAVALAYFGAPKSRA